MELALVSVSRRVDTETLVYMHNNILYNSSHLKTNKAMSFGGQWI